MAVRSRALGSNATGEDIKNGPVVSLNPNSWTGIPDNCVNACNSESLGADVESEMRTPSFFTSRM